MRPSFPVCVSRNLRFFFVCDVDCHRRGAIAEKVSPVRVRGSLPLSHQQTRVVKSCRTGIEGCGVGVGRGRGLVGAATTGPTLTLAFEEFGSQLFRCQGGEVDPG